jgi:S-adenosylmethionine:tRNA ribosyltransferase-isomerase
MHLPTSELDYELPDEAIAQSAIEPRDAARLLVTSTLTDRVFRELPDVLIPGDLLVVNRTRVRKARLATTRSDTGGSVEALLLSPLGDGRWQVMLRPARRIRLGVTLVTRADALGRALSIRILSQPEAGVADASIDGASDVEEVVADIGELPLPPYFHGTLTDEDRYQTIFAEAVGSAAAPTAALHFTDGVAAALTSKGIGMTAVELEVGLDTFRPVAVDDLRDHEIHTERYTVPHGAAGAIAATRAAGGRVIAVGTTVVRTLESAASGSTVVAGSGTADLFITPGYRLAVVDALLTNFHAPRTTLIALVATLLGDRWRLAYETAIERGYRFLSFGDSMFIDEIDSSARRMA